MWCWPNRPGRRVRHRHRHRHRHQRRTPCCSPRGHLRLRQRDVDDDGATTCGPGPGPGPAFAAGRGGLRHGGLDDDSDCEFCVTVADPPPGRGTTTSGWPELPVSTGTATCVVDVASPPPGAVTGTGTITTVDPPGCRRRRRSRQSRAGRRCRRPGYLTQCWRTGSGAATAVVRAPVPAPGASVPPLEAPPPAPPGEPDPAPGSPDPGGGEPAPAPAPGVTPTSARRTGSSAWGTSPGATARVATASTRGRQ